MEDLDVKSGQAKEVFSRKILSVHLIKLSAEFMARFGPMLSNPTSNSKMRQWRTLTHPSPGNTKHSRRLRSGDEVSHIAGVQ